MMLVLGDNILKLKIHLVAFLLFFSEIEFYTTQVVLSLAQGS